MARMEMVYLDQGFAGTIPFPYTAAHLAAALTQMINSNNSEAPDDENDKLELESNQRIDVFQSDSPVKDMEEIKEEETEEQARRNGNMNLLCYSDLGGTQNA